MRISRKPFPAFAAVFLLASCLPGGAPVIALDARTGEAAPAQATVSEPATQDAAKPKEEPTAGPDRASERKRGTSKRGAKSRSKGTGRALQPGSTAPPKNLKLVGDHWTPYTPPDPESFGAGATLHIIVPGDTLWDLADLAFGNPYLWPQIWDQNRYILDSHWIYPGDPLLLPPRPTVVSEVVPQGSEGAPQTAPATPPETAPEPAEPLTAEAPLPEAPAPKATGRGSRAVGRPPEGSHAARTVPKLVPLAGESDIRCSGFIASKDTRADYFIANQEDENKVGLTEGDMIYLNRGKATGHVDPGTEYSVVVREGEVRHPVTGRWLGYYYKRLGTVKVIAAQEEIAIGAISMACDDIRTGYDLVPLDVTPLPAKPAPPFGRLQVLEEGKPSGYIVHTLDNSERVGTGHIVDIDLGYDDGIRPGDYLTIFLPNEPYDKYRKINYDYNWNNRRFETPPLRRDRQNEYPPKIIGQMVVLTTERHTATTKIIQSVREIEVGNQVQVQ